MQTARSRVSDLVHDIELFRLLAPDVRIQHAPLECEECRYDAHYVGESVDGRGAHFRARHCDGCLTKSKKGPSETEGQMSWRDGEQPAILDFDASPVIIGARKNALAERTMPCASSGEKRRGSTEDRVQGARKPTLATLLKFAERGAFAAYPVFRVRLTEDDDIDIVAALRHLDDLSRSDVGTRVVAFGEIMAARRDKNGDLWLVWKKDQPVKIVIPADLLQEPIAQGWPLVHLVRYRPKLLLIAELRARKQGGLLRAERGKFVVDYRPYEALLGEEATAARSPRAIAPHHEFIPLSRRRY